MTEQLRPQVAQPRLSEEQIMRLIRVSEAALWQVLGQYGWEVQTYAQCLPPAQAAIRASVTAIAYAIMDNPAQFTPRTMPEEGGDST